MKWSEQVALHEALVAEEARILDQKGREYASENDALGNFKKRAVDNGIDPKQILWIFLSKHLDGIKSYIKIGHEISEEPIKGRINDARNYLFLLHCLVEEEKVEKQKTLDELNKADQKRVNEAQRESLDLREFA